jgi:hypothetical protein
MRIAGTMAPHSASLHAGYGLAPRLRGARQSLAQQQAYLTACGLIGEPVPPVMIRGGPQKKNS